MNMRLKNVCTMFRNGLAFSFAWLVMVILIIALITGTASISTVFLAKLFLLCIGAAMLFAISFSEELLKKSSFIKRLTLFVLTFIPLEVLIFYWMGLFKGTGKPGQWLIFVGSIIVMYLISLILDVTVYANRGKKYTSQLNEYKKRRLTLNETKSAGNEETGTEKL